MAEAVVIERPQGVHEINLRKVDAQTVVTTLTDAKKHNVDGLENSLSALRAKRKAGSVSEQFLEDRLLDGERSVLDESVVRLVQDGHSDLARSLISSSPKDKLILNQKVDQMVQDEKQREHLKAEIARLQGEKQAILKAEFDQQGIPEPIQRKIALKSYDPDSTIGVDPEFWKIFVTFPERAQDFLTYTGRDVTAAAQDLLALHNNGLIQYAEYGLYGHLMDLQLPEEKQAYLESMKFADKHIPNDLPDKHGYSRKKNLMGAVAECTGITEGQIKALMIVLPEYDKKGYGNLNRFMKAVQKKNDPETFARDIVTAFQKAKKLIHKDLTWTTDIIDSSDPIGYVEALYAVRPVIKKNRPLREKLHLKVRRHDESFTYRRHAIAQMELKKQGVDIKSLSKKDYEFAAKLLNWSSSEEQITDHFRNWSILNQYKKSYEETIAPVMKTGKLKDGKKGTSLTFDTATELRNRFEALGIDEQTARELYRAWNSYSSIQQVLYNDGATNFVFDTATPQQLTSAMEKRLLHVSENIAAVTNYVEQFGKEEFKSVMETFGIHHFKRYNREQLHAQYEAWKKGEEPARNVVMAALTDWNGSLKNVGADFSPVFGTDGLFFFEVGSPIDMAEFAVSVGNRERSNGRKPDIENVLINAHASPRGLILGLNEERLDVEDFLIEKEHQEAYGLRKNDYKKHLGDHYRIILKGCNTAAEGPNGTNIRDAIGEGHNVRVEATTEKPNSVIIDAEGNVVFGFSEDGKSEKAPSATYFPPGYQVPANSGAF